MRNGSRKATGNCRFIFAGASGRSIAHSQSSPTSVAWRSAPSAMISPRWKRGSFTNFSRPLRISPRKMRKDRAMRKPQFFTRTLAAGLLVAALVAAAGKSAPAQGKKDYLTDSEADQIRDAITGSDRIKLYMDFADDHIKQ